MANGIGFEAVGFIGGAERRIAQAVSGIPLAASGVGVIAANKQKQELFQQQLNKGVEGLIESASQAGLETPEKFKLFGGSSESLTLGYNTLLKNVQQKKQAETVSGAVEGIFGAEAVQTTGKQAIEQARIELPDAAEQDIKARAIEISTELRKEKASRAPSIALPEIVEREGILGGGLSAKERGKQDRFQRALAFRELKQEELLSERKIKRKDKIFQNLDLKNFGKISSTFKSTKLSVDKVKRAISRIEQKTLKVGLPAGFFQGSAINVITNALAENKIKVNKKDIETIRDFNATKQAFLADFIKSISGAQASDLEVVRLQIAAGAGKTNTLNDFVRQFNRMSNKILDQMQTNEENVAAVDPQAFDEMFASRQLPSQRLEDLQISLNNLTGTQSTDELSDEEADTLFPVSGISEVSPKATPTTPPKVTAPTPKNQTAAAKQLRTITRKSDGKRFQEQLDGTFKGIE